MKKKVELTSTRKIIFRKFKNVLKLKNKLDIFKNQKLFR